MKLVFFTESSESNSLGRTYCLWLLAERLGWESIVVSPKGRKLWRPLRDTPFAERVSLVDRGDLARIAAAEPTLVVAVKPLPDSFGLARRFAREHGLPLLLDIDDPDLEIRLRTGHPLEATARAVRHPGRMWTDVATFRAARRLPAMVSNPWLAHRYGGELVPHVREDPGVGAVTEGTSPRVVFAGTPAAHKGIRQLRDAVARLSDDGFTLTVTADPPADAKPWETWTGVTSLEEGIRLTADADIVALPSLVSRLGIGQLPVKLVDAMMLGRATIVSDVPPLPWAVGETGTVVPAGSVDELTEALRRFRDPALRAHAGAAARSRALATFSLDAVRPAFERAVETAVAAQGVRAG